MQTTSCTWPCVVPIGEDPAAHDHWCAFTDLCHTIPWVCYRGRNQWLRLALASFCLPLMWLARVVYLLVGVAEGPYHNEETDAMQGGTPQRRRSPRSNSSERHVDRDKLGRHRDKKPTGKTTLGTCMVWYGMVWCTKPYVWHGMVW